MTTTGDRQTARFQPAGLFVPLITPFAADGSIAADALEQLARRVLDEGASGIVALGTTAEAAALTVAERAQVLDICARVCGERAAPLIAGAGSNDTAASADALAGLAAWPEVSAALVVVPYYNRPGEAGVREHFRVLATESPVPLIIYNIPHRTGQALGWPVMRELAQLAGIAGVKQATGGVDQDTVAMLGDRAPGFSVLAGDDAYAPALLALGAAGAITASAHVRTREFARLAETWKQERVTEARQLGHGLARLSMALFAEPNPTVIKAVLYHLGEIPTPAVRLPLLPASAASTEAALTAAAQPAMASQPATGP
ncbi:MAG TPA: 4-hydroxy-tetrahydrodipicolinate synthase [Streptosporangiaceae bacterium]